MTNSGDSILLIRESISEAKELEAQKPTLKPFLEQKAEHLHHCIELPKDHPGDALYSFVLRYIEHVPEFIEALCSLSKEAGIYEQIRVFIELAEGYFLKPPEVVDTEDGMKALVDEAYLAHRLVEEVNDRVMISCGAPLTPMDMTISNIIIHELLGEEFANKLDFAVLYTTESLFNAPNCLNSRELKNYVQKRKQDGWKSDLNLWPCLAGDSAISLRMTHEHGDEQIH